MRGKILQSLICFMLQAKIWYRPFLNYFTTLKAKIDWVHHKPSLGLRSSFVSQRPLLYSLSLALFQLEQRAETCPEDNATVRAGVGQVLSQQGLELEY